MTSLDHSLIAQHPHRSDAMKTRLIVIVMTALAISGWSCFLLRSASRPGEGTGKRAATAAPVLESTSQVQGSGVRAGLGYDRADELANGGRLTYRRRVAVVVGASGGPATSRISPEFRSQTRRPWPRCWRPASALRMN